MTVDSSRIHLTKQLLKTDNATSIMISINNSLSKYEMAEEVICDFVKHSFAT